MRLRNISKILSAGTVAIMMTACGSSSGESSDSAPPTPTVNYGGTPSAPTAISLTHPNVMDENTFNNYSYYSGKEGNTIVIHTELDTTPTRAEVNRCVINKSSFINVTSQGGKKIAAEEGHNATCLQDASFVLPYDDTYIINFTYPTSGSAFVNVL